MKRSVSALLCFILASVAVAQPLVDTAGKMIEQKEHIINENTIIKIENLGFRVNSELPELRPTISADGNLLFFICEDHPANTKYRTTRNSQDIWYSERDDWGHLYLYDAATGKLKNQKTAQSNGRNRAFLLR